MYIYQLSSICNILGLQLVISRGGDQRSGQELKQNRPKQQAKRREREKEKQQRSEFNMHESN